MGETKREKYRFGGFELDPSVPSLRRDGEFVPIAPKALELLCVLVERAGEIVSREVLYREVWGETFVEDANVTYTVSLLRKTLGQRELIQTVPKRGYRFAGEASIAEQRDDRGPDRSSQPTPLRRKSAAIAAILAVVCVAMAAVVWRATSRSPRPSNGVVRSLAVLPFKNLTSGEDEASLSLGLTDSLITRLGSLKKFTIRPFSAVERFARSRKDAVAFADELQCDAVLVGSIQSTENRVVINVRLLRVPGGEQIWTDLIESAESEIVALQSDLATRVASSLLKDLSDSDRRMLGRRSTENAEAYRAYLRGRTVFERRSEGSFQQALDEFQKAVSLDPAYASAYSGLADVFTRRGNALSGGESLKAYSIAKRYAEMALELDPDSAEAHTSLGRIRRSADWDWEGAEKSFRRAIDLDPNSALAHSWLAQLLSSLGRHEEALAYIDRAVELDPVSPTVNGVRFPILEGMRDFDNGLRLADQSLRMDKENQNSKRSYATFRLHKGQFEEVIAFVEPMIGENGPAQHIWLSLLAGAFIRSGQPERAAPLLETLRVRADSDSKFRYSLAVANAELGRRAEAIDELRKCFSDHEERMIWIKTEPRLDSLRDDPAFQAIVKDMKL